MFMADRLNRCFKRRPRLWPSSETTVSIISNFSLILIQSNCTSTMIPMWTANLSANYWMVKRERSTTLRSKRSLCHYTPSCLSATLSKWFAKILKCISTWKTPFGKGNLTAEASSWTLWIQFTKGFSPNWSSSKLRLDSEWTRLSSKVKTSNSQISGSTRCSNIISSTSKWNRRSRLIIWFRKRGKFVALLKTKTRPMAPK